MLTAEHRLGQKLIWYPPGRRRTIPMGRLQLKLWRIWGIPVRETEVDWDQVDDRNW